MFQGTKKAFHFSGEDIPLFPAAKRDKPSGMSLAILPGETGVYTRFEFG